MNRIDVIENLINSFPEFKFPYFHGHMAKLRKHEGRAEALGNLTIGCEVEVRWRHYFPELWDKYLIDRPFQRLSPQEQYELSYECDVLERDLLPRLALTEAAGIPKGKDRYYEFAHLPTYHPYTLAMEVNILRDLNLIPGGVKHSLHITVGGLGHSRDSGLLLMALEILGYTSPERILAVAVDDKAVTWARKGRAGMRERGAAELSLGATTAIELRTLELPVTARLTEELFARVSLMANAIKNQDIKWFSIVDELEEIGREHRIDTYTNWGRPYDNPDIWKDFAAKLPLIDNTQLKEMVDAL